MLRRSRFAKYLSYMHIPISSRIQFLGHVMFSFEFQSPASTHNLDILIG